MRFKYLLAILLFSVTANAAFIPTIAVTTVGDRSMPTKNLIIIRCQPAGATNRYSGCRLNTGSAGYSPSGVKFHIYAVRIDAGQSFTSNTSTVISSCDTDLAIGTSSAPSNPVYFGGSSSLSYVVTAGAAGSAVEYPFDYSIPNGKFACVDDGTAASTYIVSLIGYEE